MMRIFTHALETMDMQMLDKVPSVLFTKEEMEWRTWIKQYSSGYQEFPTPERLHQEFPDFIPIRTPNKRGLLEAVMSDRKNKLINEFILEASNMSMAETTQKLSDLSIQVNSAPSNVMALSHPNASLYTPMTDGMFLISKSLTKLLKGVHPGELVTLVGESGVGKSLLALNTGIQWFLAGHRVLLIAADMKPSMSMMRAHSMLLKHNSELMHEVGEVKREALGSFMLEQSGELFIPNKSPKNVAEINSMLVEYEADCLIVDGTYFLQASFGQRDLSRSWVNITKVSEELKDTAHNFDVPILSVSQTNEDGKIAFSRALGQDSDIVLIISQVDLLEAEDAKIVNVKTDKNRRGGNYYANVQLNYATMSLIDKSSGIVTKKIIT